MNRYESIEISDIWLSIKKSKNIGFLFFFIGVVGGLLAFRLSKSNIKVSAPLSVVQSTLMKEDIDPEIYWQFLSHYDAMSLFNKSLISELAKSDISNIFSDRLQSDESNNDIYLNYIYKNMKPFLTKYSLEFANNQLPFYFYYSKGKNTSRNVFWSVGVQAKNTNDAYLAIHSIGIALQDSIRLFNKSQNDQYLYALKTFIESSNPKPSSYKNPSEIFNPVFTEAVNLNNGLKSILGKDYIDPTHLFDSSFQPFQIRAESFQQEYYLISQKFMAERIISVIEFNLDRLKRQRNDLPYEKITEIERLLDLLKNKKKQAEDTSLRSIIQINSETARSAKSFQYLSRFNDPLPEISFSSNFKERLKIIAVISNDQKSVMYYIVAGSLFGFILFAFAISRNLFKDLHD